METQKEFSRERISPLNRILKYIRTFGSFYYYRYSVEIGISALDGWEACIVNSIFLLLIASIIKYGWSIAIYFCTHLIVWIQCLL
ncbi:hypothetical protein NECID01_0348 [Nematocida sp. AWRm77]|nr:hypothetical protein NECID01_0348 [Nematocida sp. AWRm77]